MANYVIVAKRLTIKFDNLLVFNDLQLDIMERDWVEIIGPNFSGKSSLLKVFYGLHEDMTGSLSVLDFSLNPVTKDFQSARRKMGFVSEAIPLLEEKTIRANLAIALNATDKIKDLNTHQLIEDILARLGLQDKSGFLVSSLSSSEKLLVKLCRALITKPRMLLLDGLFDQLDDLMCEKVKMELSSIAGKEPLTVVVTGIQLKPYSPENKRIYYIESKKLKEIIPS